MEVVKSTHIQLPLDKKKKKIPSVSAVSVLCVNNDGDNSMKLRVSPLDKDALLNRRVP